MGNVTYTKEKERRGGKEGGKGGEVRKETKEGRKKPSKGTL